MNGYMFLFTRFMFVLLLAFFVTTSVLAESNADVVLQNEAVLKSLNCAKKVTRQSRRRKKTALACTTATSFLSFPNDSTAGYSASMSFCNEYRGETCCSQQHTDSVVRHLAHPYSDANFSTECRRIGFQMACLHCHPLLATAMAHGICHSLCREWYSACRNDFFHFSTAAGGLLVPCTTRHSLVCAKLRNITDSPAAMCRMAGMPVDTVHLTCLSRDKMKSVKSARRRGLGSGGLIVTLEQLLTDIKSVYYRFSMAPLLQQVLVIAAVVYVLNLIGMWLWRCCHWLLQWKGDESDRQSLLDWAKAESSKKDRNAFVREQRLLKLRQSAISSSKNKESAIAQMLGVQLKHQTETDKAPLTCIAEEHDSGNEAGSEESD